MDQKATHSGFSSPCHCEQCSSTRRTARSLISGGISVRSLHHSILSRIGASGKVGALSLHVLAYNLKRLMNIFGISNVGGPTGLRGAVFKRSPHQDAVYRVSGPRQQPAVLCRQKSRQHRFGARASLFSHSLAPKRTFRYSQINRR